MSQPTSGAALILGPQTVTEAPKDEFWREFIRVETDRFVLAALIIVLHFVHAPDSWVLPLIGGLVMSIQNQRFNRRQGR